MSDRFEPIKLSQLFKLIFTEYKKSESIFGIPEELFFKPQRNNPFFVEIFNKQIASPLGVAAGPHSQMAQNIIGAWLMGARYIELKTIQTLDELDVSKPCIDMQDEGYNCEWSQELKIKQSFNEYLNAWIMIHVLHHELGLKGDIATIFNMSAGYNLEGIMKDNVQWFFEKMKNCEIELAEKIREIIEIYPAISKIKIPTQISNNITLSTMHGCPANEIESIAKYLLTEKKLHTFVKLNPTLLGPEMLRDILNNKLNFRTNVPDIAFEHDLKYPDALKIVESLRKTAESENLQFGIKLTNTLESVNNKDVFGDDVEMMYMSGRALHPISVNLASKLRNDINPDIQFSFSAGADAFNVSDVLSCGFKTVTVCSDILKPGGYMRLNQYFEEIQKNFDIVGAKSTGDYIKISAKSDDIKLAASQNLKNYAKTVLVSDRYKRNYIVSPNIKTSRELNSFDCIAAPCKDTCATNQDIPNYLYHTAIGDFAGAYETILETNPFPAITGMICDHLCQNKCTRVNYDSSLLIREVKRFISEQDEVKREVYAAKNEIKVAVVGAGPSGLSCAYYLELAGFDVDVFEASSKAGGMVQFAVPGFRLTDEAINNDFKRVTDLGVRIHYNSPVDTIKFDNLRKGYNYIYLAPGAKLSADFTTEGNKAEGVLDSLGFLFNAKSLLPTGIGKNVVVIGGGNTAMDTARTAYRLVGKDGKVTIVYRRTINEMPADQGEIKAVLEEGMKIIELVAPEKVISQNGKVCALLCSRMELSGKDASGRPKPVKIAGSEFEIACDTIIPALGQKTDINFVSNDLLNCEQPGYQTKIENIFIGGDAKRNAATAIIAISDGRRTAEEIIRKAELNLEIPKLQNQKNISKKELMLKRARRVFGEKAWEAPVNDRQNFKLISKTLDEQTIVAEASRCLYCDEICNICTTVCPNFANRSYEIEPVKYNLQKVVNTGNGNYKIEEDGIFEVKQRHQIINIANFCNECGNCNTFCPTSSAPYKNKPKLHITKESFNNAEEGYWLHNDIFHLKKYDKLFALSQTENTYIFESSDTKVSLSKTDFRIQNVEIKNPNFVEVDLRVAAEMAIVWKGSPKLAN
ncbi:MAG TPA: putative selenate reductase subunit YgfK [Bacteroidales bacterium]|nr:putative selenate reductase subunit YgfK [Bacteroidales bacterium]